MAETDLHYQLLVDTRETLDAYYAPDEMVYVSGNLLVFYEPGNRRRHLAPDVFVVKGVPKRRRDNYLIWREGKGPDVVIELTSQSTREEDVEDKFELYQDTLRVPEYFLFDLRGEHLDPPLRGYRLHEGRYVVIEPVEGRLPSAVLGLHLEAVGAELRFYNPATGQWLLKPQERTRQAEEARQQAEARAQQAEAAQQRLADELERLRRELEELRRSPRQEP
jgi:Uma2 family endonuclease